MVTILKIRVIKERVKEMAKKIEEPNTQKPVIDDFFPSDAEFDSWEEEHIGFPPYWNPELGIKLVARVISLDMRDENFHRWVLQATRHNIKCAMGPAEDAEEVTVKPGELFTCSAYAGLPLDLFVGMEIMLNVKNKRKLSGNAVSGGVKRDLWVFEVKVSPADKKLLAERKASLTAKQLEDSKKSAELF